MDIKSPTVNKYDLESYKENIQTIQHRLSLLNIRCLDSEWLLKEHLIRKLPAVVIHFICDKANTLYPSVAELIEYLTLYIQRYELMEKSTTTHKETVQHVPKPQKAEGKGSSVYQAPSPSGGRNSKDTKSYTIIQSSNNNSYQCILCRGDHAARQCSQYPARSKCIERLQVLNRCS